jgi:CRISPR-associated Csx10 family RAMP protein
MSKLRLILSFRHSLLIGGQTSAMLADIATAREPGGAPIIPASAVKGALRIEFERLLAGLGEPVCHPSNPELACLRNNLCLSCQLFGSPGREGILRFHDAKLQGTARSLFTKREAADKPEMPAGFGYALRPGVAINRRRRVAEEDLLFTAQVVAPMPRDETIAPLTFAADVDLLETLPDWPRTLSLLQAAAKSLTALGADKSRGLGHLEAMLEEIPQTEPSSIASTVPSAVDVQVTLIADEYIRISDVKATNNFLEALEFVPGGTVRGALAKSFVTQTKKGNWQDPIVRDAFLHHPMTVSNFYPTASGVLSKPVPLSARTCKHYPGFGFKAPTPDDRHWRHGTHDVLITATLVKLLREQTDGRAPLVITLKDYCECGRSTNSDWLSPADTPAGAKRCNAPLKPLEGFCTTPTTPATDSSGHISRRTITKTTINRARFTSAEGQLYSYEVLDTQLQQPENMRLRFIGTMRRLPDELRHHLTQMGTLLIGGARGRGFGKVRIGQINAIHEEDARNLRRRLDQFTKAIQDPLKACGHPKAEYLFFTLTLTSDLIIPIGQDTGWLANDVSQRLGLNAAWFSLEKSFTRISNHGGFNMAMGIAKDLLHTFAMGSAFVFSYANDDDTVRQMIIDHLPDLLRMGIGWQREEGCGQISFCDRFHLERQKHQ